MYCTLPSGRKMRGLFAAISVEKYQTFLGFDLSSFVRPVFIGSTGILL